jgi:nitrogen fixation protein NifU and related proteins
MNPELRHLYQEVIIDHSRRPRNYGPLVTANRHAEGFNPLCGDRLTVHLQLADGIVEAAQFEGAGCAIATASASLMTEAVKGRSVAQVEALVTQFRALVTGAAEAIPMGKLDVLSGVREFPTRVKCATLAWHALHAALSGRAEPVSTE